MDRVKLLVIEKLLLRILARTDILEIQMTQIKDAVTRSATSQTALLAALTTLLTDVQAEIQQVAAGSDDVDDANTLNAQSDKLDAALQTIQQATAALEGDDAPAPAPAPSDGSSDQSSGS